MVTSPCHKADIVSLSTSLDGAPSTPLAKRAKMGGSSNNFNNSSSTPSSSSMMTPLARSSAATTGMRPSALTSSPSTSSTSTMTPHANGKSTAIPSHLSRTTNAPDSPSSNNNFSSPSSSSAVPFEERSNPLEIVETLNGHLKAIVGSATESSTSRIALVSNANPKDYVYRYMFEKVTERAAGACFKPVSTSSN
jgi:DNA polymerase alpha subunit B